MLQSWGDASGEALLLQDLLGDASSERLSLFPERALAQGSLFPGKGGGPGFSFSWFPPGFDGCRAGEFLLR